jgi:uncharacterized lipoprotein YmbA
MKRTGVVGLAVPVVLFSVLVAAGCVSVGKTGPSTFYVLDSDTGAPASGGATGVAVEVRSVKLPELLERPQIVVQKTANQIEIAETQRWAESLDLGIARVVAENLTVLVPTDRVYLTPRVGSPSVDCQVLIEIARFNLVAEGDVVLRARWTLLAGDGMTVLADRTSEFRQAMPEPDAKEVDYGELVATMSRALRDLSREIADAVREVPRRSG